VFSQSEDSSGGVVEGNYSVQLADGRVQHVVYTADHSGEGGFNAHVTYEGQAHHPAPPSHGYRAQGYESRPDPYAPLPAPYKPAPYH